MEFTRRGAHRSLPGSVRGTDEFLPERDDLVQVLAGFLIREAVPQLFIDGRGLQAVDLVHGGDRIVRESMEDVARAGVVCGDYTVLSRHGVPHAVKLVV